MSAQNTRETLPPFQPKADFTVEGDSGLPTFNVRIVRQGDRYGLDGCLVYGPGDNTFRMSDPLVEFYDTRHIGPLFTPIGQFVTRYYLSTLLAPRHGGREGAMQLDGGVPSWTLSSQMYLTVLAFLRTVK